MTLESTAFALTGVDLAFLLAAAALAGALVGAAVALRFRRRAAPVDDRIRRAPSPASVGLDDDPIIAALVGESDDGRLRRARTLPPEGDQL